MRTALNQGLERFVARVYQPFLRRVISWRYLTAALFAAFLLGTAALVAGGHTRLTLSPDVTKDTVWMEIKTPPGTPFAQTQQLAERVERAFFAVREEINRQQPEGASSVVSQLESMIVENWAGFWLEVAPHARQWLDVEHFMRDWRARVGDVAQTKVDLHYREGDVSYDLEFDLRAPNPDILPKAAAVLKEQLASYPGVFNISDSAGQARDTPEAHRRRRAAGSAARRSGRPKCTAGSTARRRSASCAAPRKYA